MVERGWLHLDGSDGLDVRLAEFLRQGVGTIWWLEQPLFGEVVLKITRELADEHPIAVPWGWWVHFDGRHFAAFERGPVGE